MRGEKGLGTIGGYEGFGGGGGAVGWRSES